MSSFSTIVASFVTVAGAVIVLAVVFGSARISRPVAEGYANPFVLVNHFSEQSNQLRMDPENDIKQRKKIYIDGDFENDHKSAAMLKKARGDDDDE